LRDSLIHIEVSRERGDPLRLVEAARDRRADAERRARRHKDDNLRYDEVWCVVDVDEHARLPAAEALAAREKIGIAVSNPCFELWALLHLVDHRAFITSESARNALRSFMPNYEKALDCAAIRGLYAVARGRANALREQHERNGRSPGWNPSTNVWVLVDKMLEAARKSRVRTKSRSYEATQL
jgi:hypothetical protein